MPEATTIRIKVTTYTRIIHTRGTMEHKNGKRRSLEDVINELIDYFEKGEK